MTETIHYATRPWVRQRAGRFLLLLISGALFLVTNPLRGERITVNFNLDWKFIKADPADAPKPECDERGWTPISTPHTFNDTDSFDDWSPPGHRGEVNQWSGRTWYRKSFVLPESYRGKKVFIEFEAARQFAEVYLNGKRLGVARNGFIPFGFDLTPGLHFGGTNVLAVMCDNRFMVDPPAGENKSKKGKGENGGPSLAEISAQVNAAIPEDLESLCASQVPWNNPHWHPAHGGLYRNVRLYITDTVHISLPLYSFLATTGPYVYATDISAESARVGLEVPVQNETATQAELRVTAQVVGAGNKVVLELSAQGQAEASHPLEMKCSGRLQRPQFWDPGHPYLYRVKLTLLAGGKAVDTCELPLGIRAAEWDARKGLTLNGRPLKLHGWGQKPTDEWPGLGAAQPDWLHAFTLSMMREAGGNFIRWGHCAGPPVSIVAADALGIVVDQPGVDGESDTRGAAWSLRAAAFRDALIYFRNHPSILIWEGGNQKVSREHASELSGYVAQYDPHGGRVYAHRRADKITAEFLQVALGTEGGREIASLPVVEGEYDREESPRRVWDKFSPPNFGYPEAQGQTYQLTSEEYAVNEVGQYWRKLGAGDHCGGANWIFSDSTSGGRLGCEVARASGEVDGARLPKEAYYVCRAMFRSDPQVHIIGHWTYPAGTKKAVYVVSNGDEVELLVNGKSLGRVKPTDRFLFTFPEVTWSAGQLKAVAFREDKPIAEQIKRTAGAPASLRLTPLTAGQGLRADGADVALVDVEAVDAQGQRCPTFQSAVSFELTGPGIWKGGYNSGKTNSIGGTSLDLEAGINRVAIRSTRNAGTLSLTARCSGLRSATVEIATVPVQAESGLCFELPVLPLAARPERHTQNVNAIATAGQGTSTPGQPTGNYVRSFGYSGPVTAVRVERGAGNGKAVYVDSGEVFAELPAELNGADWVQGATADKHYSAEDLMEIAVPAGATVFVAHDDRLPRPAWLAQQFLRTGLSLKIGGKPMRVFQRCAGGEESLTLGGNTGGTGQEECNMYIVFVKARSTLSSSTDSAQPLVR